MYNSSNKFILLVMATVLSFICSQVDATPTLSSVLDAASRSGRLFLPAAEEIERAERLFAAILAGSSPDSLAKEAAQLDLALIRVTQPEALVVAEQASAKRGRGLFVFRSTNTNTLQVPHSFKDEMTREIGLMLFSEGKFGAAAWNTVPRNFEMDGVRVNADMAHLESTYFMAFTRAVARSHPQSVILQIHGFDQGKRKSLEAAKADLILSAGHQNPPNSLRQRWGCLSRQMGNRVALYPETSRELGGTTNAQVSVLLANGFQNFIHAEMSRPQRETMRDNVNARKQFLDCLLEPLQ